MYNKLFSKIVDSSIWLESESTRLVWLTMIAIMDQDGFVTMASIRNLSRRANVSSPKTAEAVRVLESPDESSSDPDNDGRRIERVPGGWLVLNAPKYRDLVTKVVIREQTRERVRKHRAKHTVTQGNGKVLPVTPSEAVSEAVSDATPPRTAVAAPLVMSPKNYARLREQNAFVGSRLRVPNVLHDELRTKLGGVNPEGKLQSWYEGLNSDAEVLGTPIPDIFKWLRPKFEEWAGEQASTADYEKFRPKGA